MSTPTEGDKVLWKPGIVPHYGTVKDERRGKDGERAVWVEWENDENLEAWLRESQIKVLEKRPPDSV